MAFRNRLEDAEFKQLAGLQAEAPEVVQTEVQTTTQRMNMRLAEIGIDSSPRPGTRQSKSRARAFSTLTTNIRDKETALGRRLTPEESDSEVDRLFSSVEVRGDLFGTTDVAVFEVAPGAEIVVPEVDRRQIMAALQAQKKPITEENILYLYKKGKGLIK
jgi:hypothetical protein